jgi:hypothetical protein
MRCGSLQRSINRRSSIGDRRAGTVRDRVISLSYRNEARQFVKRRSKRLTEFPTHCRRTVFMRRR